MPEDSVDAEIASTLVVVTFVPARASEFAVMALFTVSEAPTVAYVAILRLPLMSSFAVGAVIPMPTFPEKTALPTPAGVLAYPTAREAPTVA